MTNVKSGKIHSGCGKLHSDAAEKLKPEEQIIVRNESNSCLVTELFANFQTSIDRKSIIGETHSVEEMEGWFESFMEEFGKPFIYID